MAWGPIAPAGLAGQWELQARHALQRDQLRKRDQSVCRRRQRSDDRHRRHVRRSQRLERSERLQHVNFGLPTLVAPGGGSGPTFQKLNQSGQNIASAGHGSQRSERSDWEMEESLDIEWAHVMAPMANIISSRPTRSDRLYAAVQAAENTSGVVAISMSWSRANSRRDQLRFDATSRPRRGTWAVQRPWAARVCPAA